MRCTPGVWSPHFRQLVSSMTPTAPRVSPGSAATTAARSRCNKVRAASWSQWAVTKNSWGGAHGRARLQSNRLDTLARQVGEQPPAIGVQMGGGPLLAKAGPEATGVADEGRPETGEFLFRHRIPSR